MHSIDLAAIDLNLLIVLDHLLDERSVTATAKKIGRTQSATSHALARLREQLQDPLLVRVGDTMQTTPRAERIAPELKRVLRSLERALALSEPFDPTTSERTFSLAGPDFLAARLPHLMQRLHAVAPRARLEFLTPKRRMFDELVDGHIDLIVSPPRRGAGIESTPLAKLKWRVFARADHPATERWGIRNWQRYPHVQIRTASGHSPVDLAARRAGHVRHIGAWLPNFQSAAALVAETDLLLTAPEGVLGDLASRYALEILRCPLVLDDIELHLHRARHLARDPAVSFFAALLTH